jgi:tetraacyldisaccharide 4'-kinase
VSRPAHGQPRPTLAADALAPDRRGGAAWYDADRPLLWPLGWLFGLAAATRVAFYRRGLWASTRLNGAVVSVGNLSVGGSGKTPVVAALATWLRDAGAPVAILSRGYGGAFRGSALVVSDGQTLYAPAEQAGDEPVMLARQLPGVVVAVGRHRDVVGRAVEARFGPRVHVLDDGFQHLRLRRDLDLLCLDAGERSRWPLPAGRLREFPAAAVRADLVLLTRAEQAAQARLVTLEQQHGHERTLRVGQELLGFFDAAGQRVAAPRRPFSMCAIARPERFAADVRTLAPECAGHVAWRDHRRPTPEALRSVDAQAIAAGADALVTTEKDAVRLPSFPWGLPLLTLRLRARLPETGPLRARLDALARRVA